MHINWKSFGRRSVQLVIIIIVAWCREVFVFVFNCVFYFIQNTRMFTRYLINQVPSLLHIYRIESFDKSADSWQQIHVNSILWHTYLWNTGKWYSYLNTCKATLLHLNIRLPSEHCTVLKIRPLMALYKRQMSIALNFVFFLSFIASYICIPSSSKCKMHYFYISHHKINRETHNDDLYICVN